MSLSIEDQVLDRFWRDKFNQPLPMAGAGEAVRAILKEQGVSGYQVEAAIRSVQASAARGISAAELKPAVR